MEPAQAEVATKDEKATTAATGSAVAEESTTSEAVAAPADAKPAADGEQGSSEAGAKEGGAASSDAAAKGQESGGDGAGLWMFLDGVNPTQQGPLTESVMLKLLRVGTAHKDMMAWSQGMSDWKPLGQVSLLMAPLVAVYFFVRAVCPSTRCATSEPHFVTKARV